MHLIAIATMKATQDDVLRHLLEDTATVQLTTQHAASSASRQPVVVRQDGSLVDLQQVESLHLLEGSISLPQFLAEHTPNGDGFGGRRARGVAPETAQAVARVMAPFAITITYQEA